MTNILHGTITFLFSDIVGSTLLWEKHPEAMKAVLLTFPQKLIQSDS
jgi:class 3 adenylate cyclase